MEVSYPLGVRGMPGIALRSQMRVKARKFRQQAQFPIRDNQIHFQELINAFSHRAFGQIEMPTDDKGRDLPLVRDINKQLKAKTKSVRKGAVEQLDQRELASAELIQAIYRSRSARSRIRKLIEEKRAERGKAAPVVAEPATKAAPGGE